MHTSFLARALYALYRFCDEDGFSTLLSSKGERSSSGEHAALWPRMFFFEFLHLGNFACLRVCLRLFVTLVHYNQFILVIERMKHRPFSILLNFSRVWHLTRSHSRLYTGKVARLVCGWVAERCGEARLETEAHVLLRPARTPRIDAKLRLLNESLQSSLIHSMDSRRKSSYR